MNGSPINFKCPFIKYNLSELFYAVSNELLFKAV